MKKIGLSVFMLLFSIVSCTNTEKIEKSDDKNVVVETIMNRRSIRNYNNKSVSREQLDTLLECAINAPSAINQQPWEVRVVSNEAYFNDVNDIFINSLDVSDAEKEKMKKDPTLAKIFKGAPTVLFIGMYKEGLYPEFGCGLLTENILLAAESMGLATCCLGGAANFMNTNEQALPYLEKLEFSEGYELILAISVGYTDESPEAKPRDASKIKFID